MSLSQAQITNFLLSFNFMPPAYAGWAENILSKSAIDFESVTHFNMLQGTYTPNDDYFQIVSGASLNFVLLSCSAQLNVDIDAASGRVIQGLPIFTMLPLVLPNGLTNPITTIYFDGRISYPSPLPMPQGVPVDYAMIVGQAVFS